MTLNRIGWTGLAKNPIWFLFNNKIHHLIVGTAIFILVFSNIIHRGRAESPSEIAGRTILADLIESEFGSLEEEELVEEFFDEESFISPTQQKYLDNLAAIEPDLSAMFEFGEEDGAGAVSADGSSLLKPGITTTKRTVQPRREIVYHAVGNGETISTIAEKYGLSVNSILWENDLSAYSIIRPGQKLAILPASGISYKVQSGDTLSKIASRYSVAEESILAANYFSDSSKLTIGQKIVIPGGKKTRYASPSQSSYTGISAVKDLLKPASERAAAGNKMFWPTEGHRITQYYSWRHYGLDIANKIGTPLYAADAGTIEIAGWGKGYGNQILINHGGGKKTRYAHLSKFYAEKGQKVDKGEIIGAMGSTGWSTGSHLHFEVIINGQKYNPLNYIK